jgi:RHS repeat-associated protein
MAGPFSGKGNYQYDQIGNLVYDAKDSIAGVTWSVYGKILAIAKISGVTINYTYDAVGNRISKSVWGVTTWYVRDGSGNVMATYVQGDNAKNGGSLTETELHVYGSNRLGILNLNVNCTDLTALAFDTLVRGNKLFELTNHLGNVLATVTDKKLQNSAGSVNVDYYTADVASASDYYPFGMQMPGRTFSSESYRYGFNGQEKSDEIAGFGNHTTAEFWEYDPRIGRRWNADPAVKDYESPYASFSNNPIWFSDENGADTVKASRVATLEETMNGIAERMQVTEGQINNSLAALDQMKSQINKKVGLDLGMSWNIFSWIPQLGSDLLSGRSDVDYMISEYAARVKETLNLMDQYQKFNDLYNRAAAELKTTFKNSTHFDLGNGVILDRLNGSQAGAAMMVASKINLNNNVAKSRYALYEIIIDGETYKYGIAHAGRVTAGNVPVRLSQQISKIKQMLPDAEVIFKIKTVLNVTKAEMKIIETEKILSHAHSTGFIPDGNPAHWQKYTEFARRGLYPKAINLLGKYLKF